MLHGLREKLEAECFESALLIWNSQDGRHVRKKGTLERGPDVPFLCYPQLSICRPGSVHMSQGRTRELATDGPCGRESSLVSEGYREGHPASG